MSPLTPDEQPSPGDKLYRYAFEQNPVPMLVSRLDDGLVLDVNPAFEQWYGRPRSEIVGTALSDENQLVAPKVRAELVRELHTTGAYSDYFYQLNVPGKGLRKCSCSAQVFTFNGEQTLVTIIHDITEQQQKQRSLEQSQQLLQTLTDFEELLYREKDTDRVLNLVVEFLLQRLDLDRAWLLTPCRADAEFVEVAFEAAREGFPGAAAASERANPIRLNDDFRQLITRHLGTGEPVSYGPQQELPLPKPMIEKSLIQSQLIICLRPAIGDPWLLGLHQCRYARDWSGADSELLKRIALRVTDRMNTLLLLRDLQQSEQRYRELFESAIEAIVLIDTESTRFVDVNPAAEKMFGVTKAELVKLSVIDISAPTQQGVPADKIIQPSIKKVLDNQVAQFEWHYLAPLGTTVIADVTLQKLPGSDLLLRATAIDITERKALEEQLVQAQKMESVGQLAGGIAHDFNNLLQGILGFSDLMLENPDSTDTQRRQLGHIHDAAARAATLTRQLLAFGRRQVLDKKNINLNELVNSSTEVLERMLGSHIAFDFIPGHDLGSVHADPVQIEQILLNLYINARDAMPEGGTLTTETENVLITGEYCRTHTWATPGRYIMISVSDTGAGMDSNTLKHIFEPFFTTKAGGGSGLGLAMAYGIIKQHDGMIQAYSEPGLGTTFKIYLPLSERPAGTIGSKITATAKGGTETILVAEDDPVVLELARVVLEQGGYNVITATDGQQAVDIYRTQRPSIDMVLLDVIMPRMGGKQAYEKIRELDPEARSLFSSGYSTNGIHTNFVLSEGLALIQKPYTPSGLLREVRKVLDQN